MTKLLLAAAALCLSLSGAYAECNYHKSVQASEPEKTMVASNDAAAAPVSTPVVSEEAKPAEDRAQ